MSEMSVNCAECLFPLAWFWRAPCDPLGWGLVYVILESWEGALSNWLYPAIGELPLSEINHAVLKRIVVVMSDRRLSPKSIDNYIRVAKAVVASAVDEEGEQIYLRKWNHAFIDMPVVQKARQKTPSLFPEGMSGLATWKKVRERTVFILSGASGRRIGETLGLEIDKHISPGFLTIGVE
jgi:hypothetical protein